MVQSLELIRIDALWEILFNSIDTQVVSKAQDFLLSLFKRVADKKQRASLVETCTRHIEKAYRTLKDKDRTLLGGSSEDSFQRISRCLDFISTFLQEFGEIHVQNQSTANESSVTVFISNQMSDAMPPKKFPLTLYLSMTVQEAKRLIASKLNPVCKPEEVMLMSKGSILKDDNMLLEDLPCKIVSEQTIMCTKITIEDDLGSLNKAPESFMGPKQPDENTQEFKEKVETLKAFVANVEDELIKYVLKKKNLDVDMAAMALLDESDVETFRKQYEKESQKVQSKTQIPKNKDTKDQEVRLSEMFANNDEIFELFFKLLTLDAQELEAKVWNLLMNLPLNRNMDSRLRSVFQPKPDARLEYEGLPDPSGALGQYSDFDGFSTDIQVNHQAAGSPNIDWNNALCSTCAPKLLYSLRIVFNLISCGTLNEDEQELYVKSEWRMQFLKEQGLTYLQGLLLDFPESALLKKHPNQEESLHKYHNTEAKVASLILDILKVYTQPALVIGSSGSRHYLLMDIFKLENKAIEKAQKVEAAKKAKSIWDQQPYGDTTDSWPIIKDKGNNTPNFGWSPEESKATSPNVIPLPDKTFGDAVWGDIFDKNNINKTKEDQGTWNDNNKVDEAQVFMKALEENEGHLAKRILEDIQFGKFVSKGLKMVETAMENIAYDVSLSKLVEDELKFMMSCFVAYPDLLQLLYRYEGVQYIQKMVFFKCQQEAVKDIMAHMIVFLSKHSEELIDDNSKDKMKPEGVADSKPDTTGTNEPIVTEEDKNQGAHGSEHEGIRSVIGGETPQNFFLKTLLPLAYNCKNEDDISLEYFQTVSCLIKMMDRDVINTITGLPHLYVFAIKFIRERPIIETKSSEVCDKVLRGFLKLAKTLVEVEPSLRDIFLTPNKAKEEAGLEHVDLLKDLYDFLFYIPGENEKIDPSLNLPKCKHKKTRSNVFKLLKVLSTDNEPNLRRILGLLSVNHQYLPNFAAESSGSSLVNFDLKNSTSYVGLKNLGCTCYMNSLIQQFFMTIPFRKALLNSEILVRLPGPTETEEEQVFMSQVSKEVYDANEGYLETQLIDNVLYQLQLLLGRLEESVGEYVVPQKFFDSIKSINGEKIVVNVQQDVNEFFNTLCDKLEHFMKNTPQKTVLNDLIGGTLSHEIISLETDYPYYGEREEAYLTIPLDIKNKRTIHDALDFYVKEDVLEGDNKYLCEQYDRKIKVMKRCCIKTLPNTLIITLKRFDFDFASMQKVKINDYFEFPTTLNVKPWTKVGLKDQIPAEANYEPPNHEDNYYDYELVGVLVHSGTADAGHYYSFIKDRSGTKKGWFEFNDNRVKPFDVKNLKNECFGSDGVESKSIYDFEFVKSRSAYILFYERSVPENNTTYAKYTDVEIPKGLCESIWRENLELLRSKYFYDTNYFNFAMDLFKLCKLPVVYNVPASYSEPSEMNKLRREAEKTQKIIKAMEKFETTGETEETLAENGTNEDTEIVVEDEEDMFEDQIKLLRLAVVLACEIYMKSKDSEQFEKWMQALQNTLENFIPGNIWMLKFITEHVSLSI